MQMNLYCGSGRGSRCIPQLGPEVPLPVPWKEGGEPDISTSFSQLFFKAVLDILDISDMERCLWYFCICAFVLFGDQGKFETQIPEAEFDRVFSSIALTLLLKSLWKLLASTDPHTLFWSTADSHHEQQ